MGGSPTQSNQAGVRELEDSEGMGNAMATGLETLFNPHSGLLRFATNALRSAKLPEATQEKMATMLMSKNPDDVSAVVKALQEFQEKNTPKVINLDTNEVLAVSGAANLMAENPLDTPSTSRAADELLVE